MIFKMIYCLFQDSTRDIWSNIPIRLQEFSRPLPSGTPSGEGVYLTVYFFSCPNTDTVKWVEGKYSPAVCWGFLSSQTPHRGQGATLQMLKPKTNALPSSTKALRGSRFVYLSWSLNLLHCLQVVCSFSNTSECSHYNDYQLILVNQLKSYQRTESKKQPNGDKIAFW